MIPLAAMSIDGGDVLAALAVIIAAYFTLRGVKASAAAQRATAEMQAANAAAATKAQEAATEGTRSDAFTAQLLERLETVESRVADLESKLALSQRAVIAAVRFIDRLVDWGRAGGAAVAGLRMPVPSPELHEYLDPTMWGESEPTAE